MYNGIWSCFELWLNRPMGGYTLSFVFLVFKSFFSDMSFHELHDMCGCFSSMGWNLYMVGKAAREVLICF